MLFGNLDLLGAGPVPRDRQRGAAGRRCARRQQKEWKNAKYLHKMDFHEEVSMKEIPLTRGLVTQIDDEDFEWLNQWKWYANGKRGISYAVRSAISDGRQIKIRMSRLILDCQPDAMVDHINGDTLDNRRLNLRICKSGENRMNSIKRKAAGSRFKGVTKHPCGKFQVMICKNNIHIYVGLFTEEREAAHAYNVAAIEHHGEYARLNQI